MNDPLQILNHELNKCNIGVAIQAAYTIRDNDPGYLVIIEQLEKCCSALHNRDSVDMLTAAAHFQVAKAQIEILIKKGK